MSEIVRAARAWLGTPYVHQAACRGAGCDCLGLLIGIWREIHGSLPISIPAYTPDWSEVSHEERLLNGLRERFTEKSISDAADGDVLLFRMRDGAVAKHVGLQSRVGELPAFIHAYSGRGVTESSLSIGWGRRLIARFVFPERM